MPISRSSTDFRVVAATRRRYQHRARPARAVLQRRGFADAPQDGRGAWSRARSSDSTCYCSWGGGFVRGGKVSIPIVRVPSCCCAFRASFAAERVRPSAAPVARRPRARPVRARRWTRGERSFATKSVGDAPSRLTCVRSRAALLTPTTAARAASSTLSLSRRISFSLARFLSLSLSLTRSLATSVARIGT